MDIGDRKRNKQVKIFENVLIQIMVVTTAFFSVNKIIHFRLQAYYHVYVYSEYMPFSLVYTTPKLLNFHII